jgi:putative aldouronate transport system permease protein
MKGRAEMITRINSLENKHRSSRWLNTGILWAMAIPCILFIILFYYVPLFGWAYAFFKFQPGKSLLESEFVGLKHFIEIFSDSELLPVLRNTLVLSFFGLAITPLPVIFAIVLSELKNKNFQKFIQTTTTFPNFISWIIVYAISMIIFSVDDGIINKLLLRAGWIERPLNVLADEDSVWFLQTAIGLWKSLGFSSIIYFAAVAGIDPELYDAASVDGAGRFRRIWHIKIPGILPTYLILLLLAIGNILNSGFEQYFVFYNPLIHDKIQVLDLYVYKIGMERGNYAFSTAVGMFKTVISVTLLFTVNTFARKTAGRSVL